MNPICDDMTERFILNLIYEGKLFNFEINNAWNTLLNQITVFIAFKSKHALLKAIIQTQFNSYLR